MHILSQILETPLEVLAQKAQDIECFVIGSGTAGVTTALELARQGIGPVAILEAGPFVLPSHVGTSPFATREEIVPSIHDLVRYRATWGPSGSTPEPNNNAWSAVGGRTIFWGGCTPRFDPWDFQDWPFGMDEFLPYYEKSEDLIGVSGNRHGHPSFFRGHDQDMAIIRLNQAGFPARRAPLGVDTSATVNGNISKGFDSSIDRLLRSGHLMRLDKSPEKKGVCLTPEAIVTRLVAEKDRIVSLEVQEAGSGKFHSLRARNVVLAGGAIQSTRLALASGLDGGNGLVGRYVGDHLFVQGLLKLDQAPKDHTLYILVMPTPDKPYQAQLQGCFRETWYSPYHATVWLDPHPEGQYILYYSFGAGTVEKDNRVELTGPGMRDYRVIYDRSPKDLEILDMMQKAVPQVAHCVGAEMVRSQINLPGQALHEIGGLRMGRDPATSVTDPFGKFHHLHNLSVADSAPWPYQGPANSYLSITAWSLRHAEALASRIRQGGLVAAG